MNNTRSGLTSLAIVVMKAGGLATRDSAWRAERAESAAGLRRRREEEAHCDANQAAG